MAVRYKFPLRWHHGFCMAAIDVPVGFRGPTMPSLALRVAKNGLIDANAIGTGVRELSMAPNEWEKGRTYAEVLQELKLLWHVLVRFGDSAPREDGR